MKTPCLFRLLVRPPCPALGVARAPHSSPASAVAAGIVLASLLASGCDEGYSHHTEVVETEVVGSYVSGDQAVAVRHYSIAVQVFTTYGAAIAGAHVRLIVSTAPEQVAYGYSGSDGVARFDLEAWPGVPVTADVSAPGWGEDFVTAYTDGYSDALVLQLALSP